MGGHLICGSKCDRCASACPQERCACICLPEKHRLVVQSLLQTSLDMPTRQPDKYDIVGASSFGEDPPCVFFGGPVADYTYKPDFGHTDADQLENVGRRSTFQSLEDGCRFNESKLSKIRSLAREYSHWRPIRGDGNCYYRAVGFGTLEAALSEASQQGKGTILLQQVADALAQVSYDEEGEQEAHEELLQLLQSWTGLHYIVQQVAQDARLDLALVRACRRLVRIFLTDRATEVSPSGLTYTELCCALDSACTGVEDFCSRAVDPMGNEAETLALDALPQQLGIGQRVWLVDRREEVGLTHQDLPNLDGKFDVHLLFKPGHYDLLYKRNEGMTHNQSTRSDGCENLGDAIDSLNSGRQAKAVTAVSA